MSFLSLMCLYSPSHSRPHHLYTPGLILYHLDIIKVARCVLLLFRTMSSLQLSCLRKFPIVCYYFKNQPSESMRGTGTTELKRRTVQHHERLN